VTVLKTSGLILERKIAAVNVAAPKRRRSAHAISVTAKGAMQLTGETAHARKSKMKKGAVLFDGASQD
jgi:broad specificity polyphosphatase/5'/3'-nucleotidase SurE